MELMNSNQSMQVSSSYPITRPHGFDPTPQEIKQHYRENKSLILSACCSACWSQILAINMSFLPRFLHTHTCLCKKTYMMMSSIMCYYHLNISFTKFLVIVLLAAAASLHSCYAQDGTGYICTRATYYGSPDCIGSPSTLLSLSLII